MTDTTPAAIEKLLKDVTPGPWVAVKQPNFGNGYIYTSVQPINPDPSKDSHLAMAGGEFHVCRMTHTVFPEKADKFAKDARFIAAARDLVPALAAERDAALTEAAALRKEVERLREALEPLAAMADRYDPDEGDDGNLECWSGLAVPKIHHLREARAALTAEPLGHGVTADDFGGEA